MSLILGTIAAALMLVAVAYADNLNNVSAAGSDTITAGGSTTITYQLVGNSAPSGDPSGCNASLSTPVTVTITKPPAVTGTTSLTFTGCGPSNVQTATYGSATPGSYPITHSISGGVAGSQYNNNANFTLTVNAAPNTAPSVAFTGGETEPAESSTAEHAYSFSITDPDSSDSWSFVSGYPTCGSGGSLVASSASITGSTGTFKCKFDDGPASTTVAVKVKDAANAESNEATQGVTVSNVAPSGTFNTPQAPVNEGSSFNLSFSSVADPSAADTSAGFQYKFDCGSGYSAYSSTDNTSCSTAVDGPATLSVKGTVMDKDGGEREYTGSVAVVNVAPQFATGYPKFSASAVSCGGSNATLEFNFTDPGADTWTVEIDWDNDGTFEDSRSASKTDSESHTYSTAGSHTAAVKVTDDDGDSTGVETATVWVNYNLSAILQPVNNTRNGQPASIFKYGSTVPVKVEITDCDGVSHPDNLDVRVFYALASTTTPPFGVDESAPATQPDAGNEMRFSDPIHVFNWSTKKVSDPTCTVRLTVKIHDGGVAKQSTYSDIGLKK